MAQPTQNGSKPLSLKERAFVSLLPTVGFNAAEAARRAGYAQTTADSKAPGWVAKSRDKSTKPHVWDAVEELRAAQAAEAGLEVSRVLAEESCIAFLDPRLLFDENGAVLPPREWPEAVARAVSSFEVIEQVGGRKTKVKLYNKGASLERLERHLGMYKEVHQHEGEVVLRWQGDDDSPQGDGDDSGD